MRVLLTGSSATLIHQGVNEALTGRFELIESPHWSFSECRQAFGYTMDDYLFFGGYPGGAALKDDPARWVRYMNASVIEPSIMNDALALGEVRNPELMKCLFRVGAPYSAQEISYRKLIGQLDEKGSTATIAHYLSLLQNAGIMSGLQKFDEKLIRERSSSPRLLVHDVSLMVAAYGRRRQKLLSEPDLRGRLIETAVGAYLINRSYSGELDVYWWREGDREVDFVVAREDEVIAIEVKSGRVKSTRGLDAFVAKFPYARCVVVGSPALSVEDFLSGAVDPLGDD